MLRLTFAAGAVALAAVAGCSTVQQMSGSSSTAICSAPQSSSAASASLAEGWTTFGVDLYLEALREGSARQNTVLSPFSIAAVQTMVAGGARGATLSELQGTLGVPAKANDAAAAYAGLACQTEKDATAKDNTLRVANAVWGDKARTFEPSFTTLLDKDYDAPLQKIDFNDSTGAAKEINDWVSSETGGKIKNLIMPESIGPRTGLVLVNALYFKGTWVSKFDPGDTSNKAFHLANGTAVPVPTMDGTVDISEGQYGKDADVVELPYDGKDLVMDFVVPHSSSSLASLEASLTGAGLAKAFESLEGPIANEVELPKFSFATALELVPVLKKLGVTDLFDPAEADLEGIDGKRDLFVSSIRHQALVEVDESGVTAVGATSDTVTDAESSPAQPPPPILIDRPFLFVIRDRKSQALLFIGHVLDPRK